MNTSIDFLFYFSSDSHDILEARIDGLPADTPPAQVYHWLLFDRATSELSRLTFQAMASEDGKHYRTFAQAEFSFDALRACLQLHDGATQLTFDAQSVEHMAQNLKDRVQGFCRTETGSSTVLL